ncbi:hypothetical protein ACLB2K_029020 [Fragaria x ananassa]
MLEGKAVIVETDMLQNMQQNAVDLASKALDFFDVTEATEIGRIIKKVIVLVHILSWGEIELRCHLAGEELRANYPVTCESILTAGVSRATIGKERRVQTGSEI